MYQMALMYSVHLNITQTLHKVMHWCNLLISPESLYQMDTHVHVVLKFL